VDNSTKHPESLDYTCRRIAVLAASKDGLPWATRVLERLTPAQVEILLDTATAQGLSPLILYVANGVCKGTTPSRLRDVLGRDLVIEQTIGLASNALAAASCDFLLEKGASFRDTLYPETWTRAMTDIDLLVHQGSNTRVLQALAGAGFERLALPAARPVSGRLSLERILLSPVGGLPVEVHTRLTHERAGFSEDVHGIIDRSVATRWSGARTPCWEDHLLHASIHLARTGLKGRAMHFLDIDRIVRTCNPDWETVGRRSREWGCSTALFLCLEATRCMFGTPVPDGVIRSIRPSGPRVRLLGGTVLTGAGRVTHDSSKGITEALWKAFVLPALYDHSMDRAGFVAWMTLTRMADFLAYSLTSRRNRAASSGGVGLM